MSRSRKAPHGVVEAAMQVADAGDRWFILLANRLGKALERVRNEAVIVADSAQKAATTTCDVGKDLKAKLSKTPREKPQVAQVPKVDRGALLKQLGTLVLEHADDLGALRARPDVDALVSALQGEPPASAARRPSTPPPVAEHGSGAFRAVEHVAKVAAYRQN